MVNRFRNMSLSFLLTYNQKLLLKKNQSQIDEFLSGIPKKFSFSKHQSELFEFYLYQSYGIDLEKKVSPAIACFIDASCPSYSGEENDICGDIELSPVVVRSSGGVSESLPPGVDTVSMGYCRLLLQAFSGLKTDMISPAESLDKQLGHLESMFSEPKETWVSSYDRLSIEKALEYGKYLYSQHSSLKNRKVRIIQTCWGETPSQYQDFVEKILPYCQKNDVLGLGGWGIFALEKNYLSTFWEITLKILPIIAKSTVKKIHLFEVTWFCSHLGHTCTPLASLLWLCDKYGLELSCSGDIPIINQSPILNSLQKLEKETSALHSYWRVNLALIRTLLASLRDYKVYQAPPNLLEENKKSFTFAPKPKWKPGDRIYHPVLQTFAKIIEQADCKETKNFTYLVCRENSGVKEIWSEQNCKSPPSDGNQMLLFSVKELKLVELPKPNDFQDLDTYNRVFAIYLNHFFSQLEDKLDWQDEDFKNLEKILSKVDSSSLEFIRGSALLSRKSYTRNREVYQISESSPENSPEDFLQIGKNRKQNFQETYTSQNKSSKVGRLGRPKGRKNKKKSRGSFYMRGVSKKGVEQWSYHYHLLLPNGLIKKSSVSVPNSKLQAAKDIARISGVEEVLKFLTSVKSTKVNFSDKALAESNSKDIGTSVELAHKKTPEKPNSDADNSDAEF